MTIRPLRDNLVAVPIEDTRRVGNLIMPDNYRQDLRTHYRAKVLASGKEAEEHAPVGSIIHVSETWGESFEWEGKPVKMGRLRDINGVVT